MYNVPDRQLNPPDDYELSKSEQRLDCMRDLVDKAIDKVKEYRYGIENPHKYRFLYQTKEAAELRLDFFNEVAHRINDFYETEMYKAYGKSWREVAPFETQVNYKYL